MITFSIESVDTGYFRIVAHREGESRFVATCANHESAAAIVDCIQNSNATRAHVWDSLKKIVRGFNA